MYKPLATYRVQFTPWFDFDSLDEILEYLHDLGISDIYASPIFRPKEGSEHGYDVVDPVSLNPELGSKEHFDALIEHLHSLDMGWIQDIVPNHMAFDSQNQMLMDVLENGRDSKYFHYFDIQLEHQYERVEGKLLAPFLGKFYGECLEQGELKLNYENDGLSVNYYDNRFPISLDSYFDFFTHDQDTLKDTLGVNHPDYVKYLGVLYAIRSFSDTETVENRYDQIQFIKRMLWELYQENKDIRKFVKSNIQTFNGSVGTPSSFDLLHDLLQKQHYRLAFWKVGTEEINYRRFFTVNDLISLRVDNEQVFEDTHSLTFELLNNDTFQGLRIDHVDGLYNPNQYLQRLRNRFPESYIVVEKILEQSEKIPSFWPIQGTTGYDFMNFVNGLFSRKQNRTQHDKIYRRFILFRTPYSEMLQDNKRLIIGKHMAGDVDNLAHVLAMIAGQHRYGSDFTLYGLRRALVEILTWFPVYRTYFNQYGSRDSDPAYIEEASQAAKKVMPDLVREIDFICRILCLGYDDHLEDSERDQWLHFVMRFQQLTGPLMAKGFEDTVLYIYNRLISLNDVGSNPENFGISDIEFHHYNREINNEYPQAMNATSTHDTKRGEDFRARLNVLSEIPKEWSQAVNRWHKLNQKKKSKSDGIGIPDKNDEYLLYQTLLGTYPFHDFNQDEYLNRISEYIVKAVREAKRHTAWLEPDIDYENGFTDFLQQILEPDENNDFLSEFITLKEKLAHFGVINSLSQVLLKMTAPGIPDFYQGSELWNFSLVDPDNRRPVDYNLRKQYLAELQKGFEQDPQQLLKTVLSDSASGKCKMATIHKVLEERKNHPQLFQKGDYIPLKIKGELRDHIFAFARNFNKSWYVVAVPRFLTGILPVGEFPIGEYFWKDTSIEIPGSVSRWNNTIPQTSIKGGETIPVGAIFNSFPVGLLLGKGDKTE